MKEFKFEILMVVLMMIFIGFSNYQRKVQTHKSYVRGLGDGVEYTLDTMQKIMDNQIKSDTTVSKVIFEKRDTISFTLSRKTLRK